MSCSFDCTEIYSLNTFCKFMNLFITYFKMKKTCIKQPHAFKDRFTKTTDLLLETGLTVLQS